MSVEIDPSELGFRRPFTVEVAQVLKIRNANNAPVAFKVKTTAPKQYCVRPNSGRIEPGHEVEVSVLLQAMKQEPPLDAKCRDKFLVQSVPISPELEFSSVSQIWDAVEKSAVQERKIRVAWLAPLDEGRLQPAATPSRRPVSNAFENTPDTQPPAYASPSEDTTVLEDSSPEPKELKQEPEATKPTPSTAFSAAAPAVAAAAASVKNTAAETYDELKAQLAKAEATITSLKNDAASGLRQRKAGGTADQPETTKQQQPGLAQAQRQPQGTEGVPVKIVALLCLASFLLAYFFF